MPRLIGLLALVAVLGIPLVAYLWETLHQLLAGQANASRLMVSLPVLVAFGALLWAGGRALRRLEPEFAGTLFLVALLLMLVFGGWITGYSLLLER